MLPNVETLDPLPEPFEMLELVDGQEIELRILSWTIGKAKITPRDGRPAKEVQILRVEVSTAAKPTLPPYWDISSKHLEAGLLGHLEQEGFTDKIFIIKRFGEGPKARFTLDVRPAS